ncbi:porin [Oceanimonas sp. CHS3-5]|uniref:porin n=1 Tax=Oceanimonas sp. CHS3-5 TaxID=3068186 RepID=UPI0027400CF6|nr:porin [Oceanimonas sp. CHS3-5]MDP5291083.1 porin [Oceanimonas sp. CHS3-5]
MKKTILALTIPALFATSASAVTVYSDEGAQVDIYGRVQYEAGEMKFQNGVKANNFGGEGEARLGVNMKYALNNDVDLIGKLEWQVVAEGDDATGSDSLDARYAWAGFRFMDTTELTFGRSQDPYALVMYQHDIFNVFGAQTSYGSLGLIDDKADDQIRVGYANNGLDLRAAYAFADADKLDNNEQKENQWSVAAAYTLPMGLGFGAAYEKQNWGNLGIATDDTDVDAWMTSVNYAIDGFYIAAGYTQQQLENNAVDVETEGYEVTATYNVDAWTLLAQYSKEETEIDGISGDFDSVDAVTLGAQYDLTAKAKLYAEYEINDDDADRDDRYGVGIQYNF